MEIKVTISADGPLLNALLAIAAGLGSAVTPSPETPVREMKKRKEPATNTAEATAPATEIVTEKEENNSSEVDVTSFNVEVTTWLGKNMEARKPKLGEILGDVGVKKLSQVPAERRLEVLEKIRKIA